MDDFGLIEYGQQTFHGSLRVAWSRFNVFPQDAPSVLNGAQERVLVGIIHSGHATRQNRDGLGGAIRSPYLPDKRNGPSAGRR